MTSHVRVQTDAREPVGVLALSGQAGLTGLGNLRLFIRRTSDGKFVDWSTNTFSASPVTKLQTLTEVDAVEMPGFYHLDNVDHPDGFLDLDELIGRAVDDTYQLIVIQDGAPQSATNAPWIGEIKEGDWVDYIDQAVSANATPAEVKAELVGFGLDHLVSVNPGVAQAGAGTYIRQIIDAQNLQANPVVLQSWSYDRAADVLTGIGWAEKSNLVLTTALSISVTWYDEDGVPQFVMADASPDAQGFFKVTKSAPGLVADTSYYSIATVTLADSSIVSGGKGSFTVGS